MRWSPALSVSGQYWEQKFFQGGHHKGLEVAIRGHQKTPVSWSTGQSSPHLLEQCKGVGVNTNVAVVDVVRHQPLKCTKHYRPPHMKVVV